MSTITTLMQWVVVAAAAGLVPTYAYRTASMFWNRHKWSVIVLHATWLSSICGAGLRGIAGAADVQEVVVIVGAVCWLWVSWTTWQDGPPAHVLRRRPPWRDRRAPPRILSPREVLRVFGGRRW